MSETENPTVFLTFDQWRRIRHFVDRSVGTARLHGIGDAIGRQPLGNVTLQREQWRFLANNLRTGDDKADIDLRHYIMRSVPLSLRPAPPLHVDGFVREDFARSASLIRDKMAAEACWPEIVALMSTHRSIILAALDRASRE